MIVIVGMLVRVTVVRLGGFVGRVVMLLVLVAVRVSMVVIVLVAAAVLVLVRGLILRVRVGRAFVDAKFHALDLLPLLAGEVHVEVAEVELRQLPFERGRFHTEIDQRADGHVAADPGEAIEEESFHRSFRF
jgi:hypothetical protein